MRHSAHDKRNRIISSGSAHHGKAEGYNNTAGHTSLYTSSQARRTGFATGSEQLTLRVSRARHFPVKIGSGRTCDTVTIDITGKLVAGTSVSADDVITVMGSAVATSVGEAVTMVLTPAIESDGKITWTCAAGQNVR